jgi:hypothetical protein
MPDLTDVLRFYYLFAVNDKLKGGGAIIASARAKLPTLGMLAKLPRDVRVKIHMLSV